MIYLLGNYDIISLLKLSKTLSQMIMIFSSVFSTKASKTNLSGICNAAVVDCGFRELNGLIFGYCYN